MKRVLVNMNRSGYFWHELNNIALLDSNSENPVVKMKREISEDSHPSISAMRTYEQYNYVFMKGNEDYILAIRNLNDPRTDGSGRSLKQHVIFEDEDKELLLKLLAYYLSSPDEFEKWMTNECFLPGQNDALCKLVPFNKKIQQLKEENLDPKLKGVDFAISSSQSAQWLQEKLEIKDVNVADYLNKLDSMEWNELQCPIAQDTVTPSDERDKTIRNLREENRQLLEELEKEQENMKKWKRYAMVSAVIAGASILILIINALKN